MMEDAMRKPDAIMLFGNPDGTKDTVFYHDVENHIWVGKVSESPEIDYFGYPSGELSRMGPRV